ncbi:MAG: hypothetical protein Q8M31_19165 [Beijerinckiaceae bacterium]|nr:hypothetical protein [Beijerinckiaceae bacterium]
MRPPEHELYASGGRLLQDLSELAAIMRRADEAHLTRVLKLVPIERRDALAAEVARTRLQALPDHKKLSRWLGLVEATLAESVEHEQARMLVSLLVDVLPAHGRNARGYIEVGSVALSLNRISPRALAVAVAHAIGSRRRAPALADLIAAAHAHCADVVRFRTVVRQAANLRTNAEAVLKHVSTPALEARSVAPLPGSATSTGGAPTC